MTCAEYLLLFRIKIAEKIHKLNCALSAWALAQAEIVGVCAEGVEKILCNC